MPTLSPPCTRTAAWRAANGTPPLRAPRSDADAGSQAQAAAKGSGREGGSQERLRPGLMRLEEAKEAGTLGEPGKQRPIVACQPAIEGSVPPALKRMQESQGDHFTGPEGGLGMFRDGAQLLIDLVEQRRDKVHRAHAALLSGEGCHSPSQGGRVV